MAKSTNQPNPRVTKIFEDLEKYLRFCKEYGYRYDEADLYNPRSTTYKQYQKFEQGKNVKDQWHVDGKME